VTICWENIFPDLVRKFVSNGAQFIINITNEAWFGKTAAPFQFVSMNVFRAVENRVFVVRCANTGVSCFIDPFGRIIERVKDKSGHDIFVRGVLSRSVIPLESNTFYTRYGDWLVWVCMVFSVVFILVALFKKSNRSRF
jgi:apolipoprotein N-acyltransferase